MANSFWHATWVGHFPIEELKKYFEKIFGKSECWHKPRCISESDNVENTKTSKRQTKSAAEKKQFVLRSDKIILIGDHQGNMLGFIVNQLKC